jgi:hypothetical protein
MKASNHGFRPATTRSPAIHLSAPTVRQVVTAMPSTASAAPVSSPPYCGAGKRLLRFRLTTRKGSR